MAPTVTRELSVVYGSTTVGGTNDVHLDGVVLISRGYETTTVEFTAVILGESTAASFSTACSNLETAFTTPRQALTVTQSSQTLLSLSHSANTGYNAQPSIRKLEEGASGRSRKYRITVVAQTPANLSGQNWLRDATMALSVDRNDVKTVRFTGRYTASTAPATARATHDAQVSSFCETQLDLIDNSASWVLLERGPEATDDSDKNLEWSRTYVDHLPVFSSWEASPAGLKRATVVGSYKDAGSGARAVYTANVATDAATELTAIDSGATWELISERVNDVCDTDEFLTFVRVYDELNLKQSSSTLNDASIVNQSLVVDRVVDRPGDALDGTDRVTVLLVSYSAWVDSAQSTDLRAKWTATIKPWLATHVRSVSQASKLALIKDAPRFDDEENRILAAQVWVAVGGSTLIRSTQVVTDTVTSGTTYIPVWGDDPYEVDAVPGPIVHIRTVLEERDDVASFSTGTLTADYPGGSNPTPLRDKDRSEGFVVLVQQTSKTPRLIGVTGNDLSVVTTTRQQVMRKVGGAVQLTSQTREGGVVSAQSDS